MTSHLKFLLKMLIPFVQHLKISDKSEQNNFFTFSSMGVASTDNSASLCFLHNGVHVCMQFVNAGL